MDKKEPSLVVSPGPRPGTVRDSDGHLRTPPEEWVLLPPGDAGLTRRVKSGGPSWTVVEKRGRKRFSQGVWAPRAQVEAARAAVDAQRATPAYERRRVAESARRDRKQAAYVEDFESAVLSFLDFDPTHAALERRLAGLISAHATPVGSGTVARTSRIPLEDRVEAAVIAWMRHQTTAYDGMYIARQKGARREARRELARRSRRLLDRYRRGEAVAPDCSLAAALGPEPDRNASKAPRAPKAPAEAKAPPTTRGGWTKG